MNKNTTVVAVAVAALLLAFAAGTFWYRGSQAEKGTRLSAEGSTTLVPAGAATIGPADARVTIVEFFDPACETCRDFYGPVKQLVGSYGGKVRLVLRYAPFHPGSDVVVKMLEASRGQSKHWETLEIMFATQELWASHHQPNLAALWQALAENGIDISRLRQEMTDPALDALVRRDLADAAALGVRKTPGYLVNGKPLVTFGYEQLEALVAAEVKAAY